MKFNNGSSDQLRSHSNDQIRSLSDDQLLISLERQFVVERKASHFILLHLKEISKRRLYAERGFSDLKSMLIKHYKQSETSANQRLKALELMLDVEVVEERLISGDLNLSTVAMAQRQIKLEEKITGQKVSLEKKAEIVESITNKTMAKAEIELFKLLPETASHPQTYERRVSEDAIRLNLTISNRLSEKLNRLKELWAHIDPSMDPVELIERSVDMTLDKIDPLRIKAKPRKATSATNFKVEQANTNDVRSTDGMSTKSFDEIAITMTNHHESRPQTTHSLTDSVKHRGTNHPVTRAKRLTYYKKETNRLLWERAQSQCEFVDRKTGRRCDCRFGLQHEHVIPLALGGTNDLSNLQLLCFTHNQLRARHAFGNKKIDSYQALTKKLFRRR